jgi:nitrite reductase/ring-hydroxylating ferredoxin subunit
MKRHEFLKSIGFRGAALMAVLTACTKAEDSVLPALTISPTTDSGTSTTTDSTSTGTGTGTGTSTGTDLSKITNRLLTIDLSSSTAANLKNVGGYITQSGIVVAQSTAGVYVAATQTCTHEPKRQVIFNVNEYYCTAHGARFSLNGSGKNSFGSRGLTVYKTATDGKTLVVYS